MINHIQPIGTMNDTIKKYQLKRVIVMLFSMALTWDVYQFAMEMIEIGNIEEWALAALLGPISVMFPAVLTFMKEE